MPTETGVVTFGREVPLGLLGCVAVADEGSNGLIDDRCLEKTCWTTLFGGSWQALIEGEVAFRQHNGGHTTGPNWPTFLKFAERYLNAQPADK